MTAFIVVFISFVTSILFGIGLFWIFKYRTKLNLFKSPSFFIKSILTIILANIGLIVFFSLKILLWYLLVTQDSSYEVSEGGSMGGAYVDNLVEIKYNIYISIISFLCISAYIFSFIKGIKYRNSQSEISHKILENKSLIKYKIGLTLLFFITMLLVLILFFFTLEFFIIHEG
jgi:hypothetical protein